MRRALLASLAAAAITATAGEVTVAVAANFAGPMQTIATAFQSETQHRAKLAIGSTGGLYTQIRNGAPFDMLLAADDETPTRLDKDGIAVAGSRFTYAIGRLVLWSAQRGIVDDQGHVLLRGHIDKIALANPKLAPYGLAAVQTMKQLGVAERLAPHWVMGENIAQTYQFVATGNAAIGFVALSQVMVDGRIDKGSGWIVPENLHSPLRQDAVLLNASKGNAAAHDLARFLQGDKARGIIRAFGYQLP